MRTKYAYLLEDQDAKRWFDNLAAKSIVTATVYLRTRGFYCELNGTDPKAMLEVAKTKAFRDGFADFIRVMERKGKAGSYLTRFKKVLNSWFTYNGINVKLKVNIKGEPYTPTIVNKRVSSKGYSEIKTFGSFLRVMLLDMYAAVKDHKVIAYGKDLGKVYDEARKKVRGFIMGYILSGEPFVLKAYV